MALIDTAVVEGDIVYLNRNILKVLAPVPGQSALKWSIQILWSIILIPEYLKDKERQAYMNLVYSVNVRNKLSNHIQKSKSEIHEFLLPLRLACSTNPHMFLL